jgi:hypothetical protein
MHGFFSKINSVIHDACLYRPISPGLSAATIPPRTEQRYSHYWYGRLGWEQKAHIIGTISGVFHSNKTYSSILLRKIISSGIVEFRAQVRDLFTLPIFLHNPCLCEWMTKNSGNKINVF